MKSPRYYSRMAKTVVGRGGNLPHWMQTCATFVTFRLADSLPQSKLATYNAERDSWLADHAEPWTDDVRAEYNKLFPKRLQRWLDAGYGSCVLREDAIRRIMEDCLRHFSDIRYSLYAYVVMPNHVHVLFMPEEGFDGRMIVRNWKSYTAKAIDLKLGRVGTVWQKESYDHLVRDVNEFNACRNYIRQNNPALAFDAYAMM